MNTQSTEKVLEKLNTSNITKHPLEGKTLNEVQTVINVLKETYPEFSDFYYEYSFNGNSNGPISVSYNLIGVK